MAVRILQRAVHTNIIFKHKTKFSCHPETGQKKDSSNNRVAIFYNEKRQYAAKLYEDDNTAGKAYDIPFYLFPSGVFFRYDHFSSRPISLFSNGSCFQQEATAAAHKQNRAVAKKSAGTMKIRNHALVQGRERFFNFL